MNATCFTKIQKHLRKAFGFAQMFLDFWCFYPYFTPPVSLVAIDIKLLWSFP
jgi:hypothetical protein